MISEIFVYIHQIQGDLKHERTNQDCLSPFLNTPITVLYPVCLNCSPIPHIILWKSLSQFCGYALNTTFHLSNHCIAWTFKQIKLAFCPVADLFLRTGFYDCDWRLKMVNTSIVSKIDKQTNLKPHCPFCYFIHHIFLSLPQQQNQFFRPKMVFCTSPLCVTIVIRFI